MLFGHSTLSTPKAPGIEAAARETERRCGVQQEGASAQNMGHTLLACPIEKGRSYRLDEYGHKERDEVENAGLDDDDLV